MSIKPDTWIRRMVQTDKILDPFESQQVREVNGNKVISYGTSSYGYDLRCDSTFKILKTGTFKRPMADAGYILDPKDISLSAAFTEFTDAFCIIDPHSFVLARAVEKIRLPRNVLALCVGKSTYARLGVLVNCTPIEPEWVGHLTMSIVNTTPHPVKIYANEGIAQLLFFETDTTCQKSYSDRGGKYQNSVDITPAML